MTKVFISYRRKDTEAIAGRIYDRIADKFGTHAVFMDIDSLPEGVDFRTWLEHEVSQAVLVLALIGMGWSDVLDIAGRRRLDNPDDLVRIEIETALSRNIPVVPVLIAGAQMPEAYQLPQSLRPLTERNAAFVDTGRDFHPHMNRLLTSLERYLVGQGGGTKRESAEWSAAEWGRLQNSTNIVRLKQFELLAHVYYVEEVRERIAFMEADSRAKAAAEAKRRHEEKETQRKAELICSARQQAGHDLRAGIVRVTVGQGDGLDNVRRIKAGSGESFRDAPFAPEMIVIPAGEFIMGSPAEEPERECYYKGSEAPQHKVIIFRPFAVGLYPVTFAEWDAAVTEGACGGYTPHDEGWGRGDHPVINVSWEDAQAYAKWLRERTGKEYRLLSEAEWEYAARAGTKTPFWWGESISPEQANYDGNYVYDGGGKKGEYRQRTLPVKSFQANPWGLYQVHGNVWEWCEDIWHDTYNGAHSDGAPWTTGESSLRVVRGGSWGIHPGYLRSALRDGSNPRGRSNRIGFRLACTI